MSVRWRSFPPIFRHIIPEHPHQSKEYTLSSTRTLQICTLTIVLSLLLLTACKSGDYSEKGDFTLAPLGGMPAEVKSAPKTVQQAYQFAVANPDVLKQIPCYCGCGNMGHSSNYACYVSGSDINGSISFDNHALGCSICVDITQDTMRLIEGGKTIPEINAYVDQAYSQYGSSNIP